jgi:hypothetical protein
MYVANAFGKFIASAALGESADEHVGIIGQNQFRFSYCVRKTIKKPHIFSFSVEKVTYL